MAWILAIGTTLTRKSLQTSNKYQKNNQKIHTSALINLFRSYNNPICHIQSRVSLSLTLLHSGSLTLHHSGSLTSLYLWLLFDHLLSCFNHKWLLHFFGLNKDGMLLNWGSLSTSEHFGLGGSHYCFFLLFLFLHLLDFHFFVRLLPPHDFSSGGRW